MTTDEQRADARLAEAARLGAATRRNTTWYVRWLVIYGLGSLAIGGIYAVVGSGTATVIAIPLWIVLVAGLAWWASTRRTAIRGFGMLHGTVIVVWSLLWVATVSFGTGALDTPAWWLAGTGLMAATAFAGAAVAARRSRR